MSKYSYAEFFQKFPHIYEDFHRVVGHAKNFYDELDSQDLLDVPSVLSIGAGEGELELDLMNQKNMEVGFIEPNPVFVKKFKERLKSFGTVSKRCEIFNETFQDYQIHKLYDLVIAIHSWYALGCDQVLLEKALRCLKPRGRLFVTIISRSNLVWKIARLGGNDSAGDLCSEDLSKWAMSAGFPHKYVTNYRRIPLETIFSSNGDMTESGIGFLTFPTFSPWNELSRNLQ